MGVSLRVGPPLHPVLTPGTVRQTGRCNGRPPPRPATGIVAKLKRSRALTAMLSAVLARRSGRPDAGGAAPLRRRAVGTAQPHPDGAAPVAGRASHWFDWASGALTHGIGSGRRVMSRFTSPRTTTPWLLINQKATEALLLWHPSAVICRLRSRPRRPDRKSTRLNSSHERLSRMPSSA